MTISAQGVRAVYPGNGTTGPFTLQDADAQDILFADDAEIIVTRYDADNDPTPLVQGVDYTITGEGAPTAGAVTLTDALAVGETLVLLRVTARTQLIDLIAGGKLSMALLEGALDKLTRIDQEDREAAGRSVLFHPTYTGDELFFPAPNEGGDDDLYIAFVDGLLEAVPAPTMMRSGLGPPSGDAGNDGDFYLDVSSSPLRLYGPREEGLWGSGNSLEGPAGPTGATGPQGPPGDLSQAVADTLYQPLDSDLTAIAALSTAAFGRSLLTQATAVAAQSTLGVREVLTANRTYYVRTDGSDSNTGLVDSAGGAFLTPQKAYDVIADTLDLSAYKVTIQIRNGTYTAGANAVMFIARPWVGGKATGGVGGVGGGAVHITGDRTTPSNVVFNAATKAGIFVNAGLPGVLDISGIKFVDNTGGGRGLFNNASGANINIADVDFGGFGVGWQMHAAQNCTIFCYDNDYTISGSASMHALIEVGGRVDLELGTVTLTGTPAFSTAFIRVESGGTFYAAHNFSGAATGKRFLARSGGSIQLFDDAFGELGSAALTRLPGNAAGEFLAGSLNGYSGALGLRVGFTGAPTDDRIEVGDANFQMDFNGGNPLILFDTGDYILLDRASNAMAFHPGGVNRFLLDGNGIPIWQPGTATPPTLGTNGQIAMTPVSNTNLRFSHRGSDGTTRNGNIPLSTDGAMESITVAASDETTNLTTGTNKVKWRMPYAFTVTAVRASLSTAQTAGSIFTVDINEGGTTILSTKLTIDNNELTSVTAATPPVISDANLADDAEMSIDIDQVGTAGARGLKVTLLGFRP